MIGPHLASSVGTTFLDSDDGPDSGLLCRELKWLMEDAIEDHTVFSQMGIENNQTNVRLRMGIEELYNLWKQRIEERRPFQYLVGCEHWRDLVLSVQDGVLIPRPETELIVDLVADVVSNNEGLREGLWADFGTGSGALAIGIGRILGSCGRVIATDLSPVALSVAAFNVQKYGLQLSEFIIDVIELRQGSWFKPLKDLEGKLAGIVSNQPYILSDNIPGLQAEVGRHEPRVALDGGINGINDLLHLCNGAALMLRPGGFFIFEICELQKVEPWCDDKCLPPKATGCGFGSGNQPLLTSLGGKNGTPHFLESKGTEGSFPRLQHRHNPCFKNWTGLTSSTRNRAPIRSGKFPKTCIKPVKTR
uniref:Release factor glutamine methyltransferase n=1 Tax=Quercus lobata TaxID=97700 RepID=A0A7N2L889_QUELO